MRITGKRHNLQKTTQTAADMRPCNKKPLWRIRRNIIIIELTLEILIIAAIIIMYSVKIQSLLLLTVTYVICLIVEGFLERYYYRCTAYICPHCHTQFKPKFWNFFLAFRTPGRRSKPVLIAGIWELFNIPHKPHTRKLTCPSCGQKSYCLETDAVTGGEQDL